MSSFSSLGSDLLVHIWLSFILLALPITFLLDLPSNFKSTSCRWHSTTLFWYPCYNPTRCFQKSKWTSNQIYLFMIAFRHDICFLQHKHPFTYCMNPFPRHTLPRFSPYISWSSYLLLGNVIINISCLSDVDHLSYITWL